MADPNLPAALAATAQALAAVMLVGAAIAKLRDLPAFRGAVAGYRLLPGAAEWPAAALIPAAELAAAAALLLAPVWGAPGAAMLLGGYGLAMAINLVRGVREIDCGCHFGGRGEGLRWSYVAQNAIAAALLCASLLAATPALPERILAGLAGLLLGALVIAAQLMNAQGERFLAQYHAKGV